MADSIWWTKMLHKDFCAHYCEMSDSEIVADVRRSVASLMMQRSEGSDFGALMVRMAMQRIKEKHDTAVSNGSQGGRPRINKENPEDGDTREVSQGTRTAAAITRNEPLEKDPLDTSSIISAGAPTREDGVNVPDSGDAGYMESATPATISQDAATRKGADDSKAPTSCNHYDQEALDLLRAGVMDTSPASTREGQADMPADVGEVYAFADAEGLDSVDAYECWSVTVARDGRTADGRKVRNWKAYVRRWCATRAKKRRTA